MNDLGSDRRLRRRRVRRDAIFARRAMKRGLYVAPFDELADPRLLAELAMVAESRGWDGLFLWDRIAYPPSDRAVADPWVALSAIASMTDRLRLGPMITPLSRRRVQKVARETVTLDHLSNGRLTLGVGLGNTEDLRPYGEAIDPHERAACWMRAWSGSVDSGPARSAPFRYSVRGSPSGSRRTGPIGARSDARLGGTGCSRSISPDRSSSPSSPKLFGSSVLGARMPSISS
jgi:alkanesulfonate monooxygenase SsuD/methylene tetrahydromethanopterin reductase-like flavin-dependent oxidoreductase (luciferase family)